MSVEVAPGVYVMTSRRFATTSTVIAAGRQALVIDPAWDEDELASVASLLSAQGLECVAGLATHEHYDHVLWHPDLPDVPRYAAPWACERLSPTGPARHEVLAPLIGDLPEDLMAIAGLLTPIPGATRPASAVPGRPYPRSTTLPEAIELHWSTREVIVHEHDAHVRGHLAVELVDAGVLVAGDMLSDVEIPYPDLDDPDLSAYLVGLDRLADAVRRSRVLIPGHGTPTDDPMSRLDADRRYLDAILAGREVEDPRLAHDGMAELHAANVERARATSVG
ncbi:MAG: MBL fold metallo-hydrolase [Candidatus Nanopelagicales bacterium]